MARRRWPGHLLLVGVALLPAAALAAGAWRDTLGANPIETLTHQTGLWTLRLLLATLAITPLRQLFGWSWLAPYRRTLGLLAFSYVSVHFSIWLGLDLFFDWQAAWEDIVERPYITAGMTGLLCLLPLAITSTRGWIRRLGRRWTVLHRLVYVAALAGIVHFLWQVKADLREPLVYAAILAALLGARMWRAWVAPRLRQRSA